MTTGGRIGLVLAGGGARGAYEIGALSCILPELDKRGWRPTIVVGASVGAINATHLAARRHLGVQEAIDGSLALWREVTEDRVVRPLISPGAPWRALRGAARTQSRSRVRRHGLLDPSPLADSLGEWVDWESLHRNVAEGIIASVAVIACAARSGHSVAFVEGQLHRGGYPSHVIDYFPTRLTEVHVRASTAIPLLFPPVRVEDPHDARGWYFDGGTRLNTPIKPALDLGAQRLVVIGTDCGDRGRHAPRSPRLRAPRRWWRCAPSAPGLLCGGSADRRSTPAGRRQQVLRRRDGRTSGPSASSSTRQGTLPSGPVHIRRPWAAGYDR
ncbi:MAG: hypothetical protein DLM54_06500 [Acidimicrobiales bacterium]|nr:MAG: hypothetical protein DLM54_06500 [Acidimicrobiales bacterium]